MRMSALVALLALVSMSACSQEPTPEKKATAVISARPEIQTKGGRDPADRVFRTRCSGTCYYDENRKSKSISWTCGETQECGLDCTGNPPIGYCS